MSTTKASSAEASCSTATGRAAVARAPPSSPFSPSSPSAASSRRGLHSQSSPIVAELAHQPSTAAQNPRRLVASSTHCAVGKASVSVGKSEAPLLNPLSAALLDFSPGLLTVASAAANPSWPSRFASARLAGGRLGWLRISKQRATMSAVVGSSHSASRGLRCTRPRTVTTEPALTWRSTAAALSSPTCVENIRPAISWPIGGRRFGTSTAAHPPSGAAPISAGLDSSWV
eukprot:scaffold89726_cov66-Phaeocystis_antarctica.AAC.2